MENIELIEFAKKAREKSYSPYSNYAVGAAILMKDGNVILGANIENAVYPLGICAERCALFNATMDGYKKEDMVAISIVADSDIPPYPCGSCRQVLSELFPCDGKIIIANLKGKIVVSDLKELLPYAFSNDNLE